MTDTTCQNCGTELLGPHCYKCGQPVNGLVRHFTSILGDFLDSVFDLDSRMVHTAAPLLARPGFLTREYFAGHRVRYVSPVRLFFFLSILTFFVAQLTIPLEVDASGSPAVAAQADADADDDANELSFNGRPWDPVSNPLEATWLPDFANDWINRQVGRAVDNIGDYEDHPERFKVAILRTLPSTLFVLLPIFALMLKVAYVFKRRLYMEHLIVALHSHAFLCLALLLVLGFSALGDAVPVLATACGWAEGLLLAWMPIYLLIMQQRVYGQGWPMTLLKYFVLGTCYCILLGFGMVATILASLVWG